MKKEDTKKESKELIHREEKSKLEEKLIYIVCILVIFYGIYGKISTTISIKNNYSQKIDVTTKIYSLYYVNKIICEEQKIYLLDSKTHAVQIFNFEGQHLFTFETAQLEPIDMSLEKDRLYIILKKQETFIENSYMKYEINVEKISFSNQGKLKDYKVSKAKTLEYTSSKGEKYSLKNKSISSKNLNIKLKDIPKKPKSTKIYEYLTVLGILFWVVSKSKIIDRILKKSNNQKDIL